MSQLTHPLPHLEFHATWHQTAYINIAKETFLGNFFMNELADSLLLLDTECDFYPPEIEEFDACDHYEAHSLSPPIDFSHHRLYNQQSRDASEAIDLNFRKRMVTFSNRQSKQTASQTDLRFTICTPQRPHQSLLRKAFSPEQIAFQKRLSARKAAKQSRKLNEDFEQKQSLMKNNSNVPVLEPYLCIW